MCGWECVQLHLGDRTLHERRRGSVQTGEYAFDGASLKKYVLVPAGVTLEPLNPGESRPLIKQTTAFPACNCSMLLLEVNDVIEDMAIDQAAGSPGHAAGAIAMTDQATIERSIISGVADGLYFSRVLGGANGGLRDTLVTAGDGAAIYDVAEGITINLDNVTAIAQGAQGVALDLSSTAGSEADTVNAKNTIFRGGLYDVKAEASGSGTAVATLDYSDARTAYEHEEGAKATITDTEHPTHGEPLFVSATDFEELPGSPTINAGTSDAASGELDVERSPRVFGGATDIGAYEFHDTAPVVSTGAASAVGQSSATLAGTVDPEGLASSWYFNYGPTSAFGLKTAAQTLGGPGAFKSQSVGISLSGLAAGTTYHYELVASNVLGATSGTAGTFTTAAATATATPAPSDSALRLSSTRFRAASRGGSVTAARTPVGTTVSYGDSQTATTTFGVLRRAQGVRSGHACTAPPRHRKRGRHYVSCARYVAVGSFSHADIAGVNRLRFSGRVDGHRLTPGAYRLTATPRNAAGKSGAALSASFMIVR